MLTGCKTLPKQTISDSPNEAYNDNDGVHADINVNVGEDYNDDEAFLGCFMFTAGLKIHSHCKCHNLVKFILVLYFHRSNLAIVMFRRYTNISAVK